MGLQLRYLFQLLTLLTNLTSYKILVHAAWGSSSHAVSMLEVVQELYDQGHETYYMGTQDNLAVCKGYNLTDKISLGEPFFYNYIKNASPDSLSIGKHVKFIQGIHYEAYTKLLKPINTTINQIKPDLIICDFFALACIDLSQQLNVPSVIMQQGYSGFVPQPGYINSIFGYHPTYLTGQSFWVRFDAIIAESFRRYFAWRPFIKKMNKFRQLNGLSPINQPYGDFSKALVMVNSFLGFEPIQQVPSNFKFVGPIINTRHAPLDTSLQLFMSSKSKIVYIAFGSGTRLNAEYINQLLISLDISLRNKDIDGIVWGLGKTAQTELPDQITLDEKIYTRQQILNGESNSIRILKWAPQLSLLQHKSTVAFISHCGLASVYESIIAKKPVIGLPQFGDQFRNVRFLEESNAAFYISKHSNLQELHNRLIQGIKWATTNDDRLLAGLNRLNLIATQNNHQFGFNGNKKVTSNFLLNHLKLIENCKSIPSNRNSKCELDYLIPPAPLNSGVGIGVVSNYGSFFYGIGFNWDIYLFALYLPIILLYITIILVRKSGVFVKSKWVIAKKKSHYY